MSHVASRMSHVAWRMPRSACRQQAAASAGNARASPPAQTRVCACAHMYVVMCMYVPTRMFPLLMPLPVHACVFLRIFLCVVLCVHMRVSARVHLGMHTCIHMRICCFTRASFAFVLACAQVHTYLRPCPYPYCPIGRHSKSLCKDPMVDLYKCGGLMRVICV